MKSLLDPSFKYVHSSSTNVKETFERVRREQQQTAAETAQKVAAIKPRVKARTP